MTQYGTVCMYVCMFVCVYMYHICICYGWLGSPWNDKQPQLKRNKKVSFNRSDKENSVH